jgi:predicted nucleic acid-binding protein
MVLAETLNGLADKGEKIRMAAVTAVMAIRNQASTKVIPQTSALFTTAFDLYRKRSDKDWGLVDCASFSIMEQEGISEALTTDKNFEQAGFKALLRNEG